MNVINNLFYGESIFADICCRCWARFDTKNRFINHYCRRRVPTEITRLVMHMDEIIRKRGPSVAVDGTRLRACPNEQPLLGGGQCAGAKGTLYSSDLQHSSKTRIQACRYLATTH